MGINLVKRFYSSRVFSLLCCFVWLSCLLKTDSYLAVYLLVGVFSVYSLTLDLNYSKKTCFFASLLSILVSISNINSFHDSGQFFFVGILFILNLLSGFFVFLRVVSFLDSLSISLKRRNLDNRKVSFFLFFVMFVFYGLVLLFFSRPGILSNDSVDEVLQVVSGNYSNHHPVFYTWTIGLFVNACTKFGLSLSSGILAFSLFQILLMSLVVAYSCFVMLKAFVPFKVVICSFVFALFMPYNIAYSFTVWKDVFFAIVCLLFFSSSYDFLVIRKGKTRMLPLILLSIATVGICLFRSNGFIGLGLSSFACLIMVLCLKRYYSYAVVLIAGLLVGFLLKGPFLDSLNIKSSDTVESLSIPMQQISRIVVFHSSELTDEEVTSIEKVVSIDLIKESYDPHIHDPIKGAVRFYGDMTQIKDHKIEYLKLYISLCSKYPADCFYAWVNQTKGFYNSGYDNNKVYFGVVENEVGLDVTANEENRNIVWKYYSLFEKLPFLNPFLAMGLYVWLLLYCLYRSVSRKNAVNCLILITFCSIWGTYLIATPVFNEFRYIYYIILCSPFFMCLSFLEAKDISRGKR